MRNNTFTAKTDQFHKVKFNDGLVDFIFPGADRWPRSRPSADLEGTLGRPCPRLLTGMLLPAGGPSLLQLQGFRSSWEEGASRDTPAQGGAVWGPGPPPPPHPRAAPGTLGLSLD